MEELILNDHNKAEYEPAHTCDHIPNQTMVRKFECPRSRNAHILDSCPTDEQVKVVEDEVN